MFDVARQHGREGKGVVHRHGAEFPDMRPDGEFVPEISVGDVVGGEHDPKRKNSENDGQPAHDPVRRSLRIHAV